jgi:hypothetical protein
MDSWFPERLPVHFHRSTESAVRGALADRAPFAVLGGAFVLAAAVALVGRLGKRRRRTEVRPGWASSRRGLGSRGWRGG